MSLHADFDRPRLIFKPFEPPEIEPGEFPVKVETLAEKLKRIGQTVAKITGHAVAIGFFVLVSYGFIHGPIAEKPKYDDAAYQAAVAWVMEE